MKEIKKFIEKPLQDMGLRVDDITYENKTLSIVLDSDNVRIISQNSNSNLAYWMLERNLYLTNTTSLDIHVARSRIL